MGKHRFGRLRESDRKPRFNCGDKVTVPRGEWLGEMERDHPVRRTPRGKRKAMVTVDHPLSGTVFDYSKDERAYDYAEIMVDEENRPRRIIVRLDEPYMFRGLIPIRFLSVKESALLPFWERVRKRFGL